jgi:hypothetical protein
LLPSQTPNSNSYRDGMYRFFSRCIEHIFVSGSVTIGQPEQKHTLMLKKGGR